MASVVSFAIKAEVNNSAASLPCKVGEFGFEFDMIMRGAGEIARTARTGACNLDGFIHGGQNFRMLRHAQKIVRTPYGNALRTIWRTKHCCRIGAAVST